jgi:dTDP-4-amino-4,6-dideoxygalactose transaminase
MVVTNDSKLAGRVRSLREYGWKQRYVSQTPGWNSRLDELQAAILRVKLRHLEADNTARMQLASAYDARLLDTPLTPPRRRSDCSHVFHLYVTRCPQRDDLQRHLKKHDVAAVVHYPVPIHQQAAYHSRLCVNGALPETEKAVGEILSLPIYPEITDSEQAVVVEAIRQFYGACR